MSLFGLDPSLIKPTALTLNILVASIGTWQFWRAGHFSWPLFWPFALFSVPFAFLGGYISLPHPFFKIIVGVVLLFSSAYFLLQHPSEEIVHTPPRFLSLSCGAGLGLFSGLTGTGGGIFLTPLLLFMKWAGAKRAGAVSALFILVNSIAGLLGNLMTQPFPSFVPLLVISALLGGFIGSYLGSWHFPPLLIKRFLSLVLCIAGIKLILTS